MLLFLAQLACRPTPAPTAPVGEADADADADADSDVDTDADTDAPGDCASAQATMDARCVSCHGGELPLAGLDLTDITASVGAPSSTSLDLIAPFAPADSYLLLKIDGTHATVGGTGTVMPPPGTASVPPAERAALGSWVAAGATCDPGGDADTDADADADADADTDTDTDADPGCDVVQTVIDASCTGCHAGPLPAGHLDLTDVGATVGAPSGQSPLVLVEPFAPDDSYLWRKLLGTHFAAGGDGDVMPPPGEAPISAGDRAVVGNWIAAGAVCDVEADTDTDTDSDSDADTDADTGDTGVDPVSLECLEVQAIVDGNCTACHGSVALGGLDLRRVEGLVGLPSHQSGLALVAAGDSAASYLVHKLQGTHASQGGSGQPMPPGGPLDPADLSTITAWIDGGASCVPDPTPVEPNDYDPNDLDQAALFMCDGSPSSSQARLRRMEATSWRKTIGQSSGSPAASNPLATPSSARFTTYPEGVGMDAPTLDLYLGVLDYAGAGWTQRFPSKGRQHQPSSDSTLNCMFNDASPTPTCIDHYLREMLENGAYYRPPTQAEVDRLTAFTEAALVREASEGWTRPETLTHVTSAAWLTVPALFPSELGEGTPDPDGRHRLSDWEIARWVSSVISDRPAGAQGVFRFGLGPYGSYTDPWEGHLPDIQLAAANGTIQQPAVAGALLRQYAMGTDAARVDTLFDWADDRRIQGRAAEWTSDRIDRFFLELFDVADFPTVFKDRPEATSAWDGTAEVSNIRRSYGNLQSGYYGHESTLLQQLEDAIARVVVNDQDVLHELLTTRELFLASTTRYATSSFAGSTTHTSYPYGISAPIGETTAERWQTLPTTERAGMLTHPAWLASHGDAFEDGPSMVSRGRWIRENLLCQTVPPLEFVTVEAQLLATDGTKTARERVDESIEPRTECMVCHQYMNSLGRAFETYNHAGFLRADDHGNAPNGATTLTNLPDPALNRTYTDAIDLVEALADSPYVERCFVRQTFRFFAGRDETLEDACVLDAMQTAYTTSGGSFVSMLEALATHDAMLYRHRTEDAP
ncbi:MAG: DUF1588 domain-containing protein [Alphaproteobacteria bacterium]|nr:DUF1588 domain-containing protein [Alphaproteobacteria bacterium]